MPLQELPEDFYRPIDSPSNSSLSSNSSGVIMINARYVRSTLSSESSGTVNDEFETSVSNEGFVNYNEDIEEEATYQPIKLPKEPTLEELLVRKRILYFK